MEQAKVYSSLHFPNLGGFVPEKFHPLLHAITAVKARDAHRLRVRLKVATGTYILQTEQHSVILPQARTQRGNGGGAGVAIAPP